MVEPDLKTPSGRLQWARESYVTSDGGRLTSPRKAAKHFGWNENTYKSHENGVRQGEGLKLKHAERYARAFGVDIAWLMTGRGTPFARRA
jgi:hypothetical protein